MLLRNNAPYLPDYTPCVLAAMRASSVITPTKIRFRYVQFTVTCYSRKRPRSHCTVYAMHAFKQEGVFESLTRGQLTVQQGC